MHCIPLGSIFFWSLTSESLRETRFGEVRFWPKVALCKPTIDYQRLSPLARMRFTTLLQALVACKQLLCSIEQFLGRPTPSQLVRQPCWIVVAPEMVGQRVQGRVDLQYLSRAPRFCVNYLRVKHWRLQCQCSSLRRLLIFETADATIL